MTALTAAVTPGLGMLALGLAVGLIFGYFLGLWDRDRS